MKGPFPNPSLRTCFAKASKSIPFFPAEISLTPGRSDAKTQTKAINWHQKRTLRPFASKRLCSSSKLFSSLSRDSPSISAHRSDGHPPLLLWSLTKRWHTILWLSHFTQPLSSRPNSLLVWDYPEEHHFTLTNSLSCFRLPDPTVQSCHFETPHPQHVSNALLLANRLGTPNPQSHLGSGRPQPQISLLLCFDSISWYSGAKMHPTTTLQNLQLFLPEFSRSLRNRHTLPEPKTEVVTTQFNSVTCCLDLGTDHFQNYPHSRLPRLPWSSG